MDLASVLAMEKTTSKLQSLEDNFYDEALKAIRHMKIEVTHLEDQYGLEAQLLTEEIKNSKRILLKLFHLRLAKIQKKVALDALKTNPTLDTGGLMPLECPLYRDIYEAVREAAMEFEE
jgi:DNA replication initiation complex subunit (GINS family)